MTICRPDRQTVIRALCRSSPVPAVPPASVAPATCLSNQNDLADDSGQSSLFSLNVRVLWISVSPSYCNYRLGSTILKCLGNWRLCYMHANHYVSFFFISACQLLHVSVLLHALSPLSSHAHTNIREHTMNGGNPNKLYSDPSH